MRYSNIFFKKIWENHIIWHNTMIIWDSTTTDLVIPIINKPRSQRSNLWHLCATGDVHHDTSTPLDLTARV